MKNPIKILLVTLMVVVPVVSLHAGTTCPATDPTCAVKAAFLRNIPIYCCEDTLVHCREASAQAYACARGETLREGIYNKTWGNWSTVNANCGDTGCY